MGEAAPRAATTGSAIVFYPAGGTLPPPREGDPQTPSSSFAPPSASVPSRDVFILRASDPADRCRHQDARVSSESAQQGDADSYLDRPWQKRKAKIKK